METVPREQLKSDSREFSAAAPIVRVLFHRLYLKCESSREYEGYRDENSRVILLSMKPSITRGWKNTRAARPAQRNAAAATKT
jgi:hypothetical protein